MIFGRTWQERDAARDTWKRRFALIPVPLWDGRWCWLSHYWVRKSCADPFGGPGVLLSVLTQRFVEIPEPRDRTPPPPKPTR